VATAETAVAVLRGVAAEIAATGLTATASPPAGARAARTVNPATPAMPAAEEAVPLAVEATGPPPPQRAPTPPPGGSTPLNVMMGV